MKKCVDCNVEMIEGYGIRPGKHGRGHTDEFLYLVKDGSEHFGIKINQSWIKCRVCPNCGKIELYIEPEKLK
jgi:hypothetical protein